jgi:hypothetical protein
MKNPTDIASLFDRWRELRWRYEVMCRMFDADMDAWRMTAQGLPLDLMERLEAARQELNQVWDALMAAIRLKASQA